MNQRVVTEADPALDPLSTRIARRGISVCGVRGAAGNECLLHHPRREWARGARDVYGNPIGNAPFTLVRQGCIRLETSKATEREALENSLESADAVRIALNNVRRAARCYVRRENTMNAAESKLSTSDTVTTEGVDIRSTGRGIRPAITPVPGQPDPYAENPRLAVADVIDDILDAGATAIADIEKLIDELQTARNYLEAEGERVRRLSNRYAHLTQTASASVKIIAESLGKWRKTELEPVSHVHAAMPRSEAPQDC